MAIINRSDTTFQGKRVSWAWAVILRHVSTKIEFRLNSGRRTMKEQTHLYVNRGKPGFAAVAAVPNPNAPHIKVGRANHSLDIDQFVGQGERGVQTRLGILGLDPVNDVASEGWHLTVVDEAALIRVATKLMDDESTPTIRRGVVNRTGVRMLQVLLRRKGMSRVPLSGKYDLATRLAVRRFQRKRKLPLDGRSTVGDETWAALRR